VAGRTLISHSNGLNNGNLVKSTYGAGAHIDYAYDSYDQLIKKTWNYSVVSTITKDAKEGYGISVDNTLKLKYEYAALCRPP